MPTDIVLTLMEIDKRITDEYTFWKEIYEGVYFDIDVKDGVNLNTVREHILQEKSRCEEILGDCFHLYPDSYFFPVPDIFPDDFMVTTKRFPLPFIGMIFNVAKNLPFSEIVKFDWSEVFVLVKE